MSFTELNLDTWDRKAHFHFFKTYEEPFFGVSVDIDCTLAFQSAKRAGVSFFLVYLHKALIAANNVEPFRYRIVDDKVIVHNKVNAASTINRPNGTFGFSNIEFQKSFDQFEKDAQVAIEQVRNSHDLNPSGASDNVIHFSALPWIKFTSVSHARNFSLPDSCPKISIGRVTDIDGKKIMPFSVHVHHALMDGYHVGLFIDEFQQLMDLN
ncbi:chloramphenicol acetyltransferase [Alteromonas sp. ASW11-130]|uniref:chloramphenicol acetyltransferase n=1 Tax=Alteromonas sp. ASW11-130 TaxID=3015775 RepID=UPI002241F048|nr:chloramphenicol acetyltransferase [Alteromonas sp. ASW11-130]MCW8091502.1 chloramphenicol acetyltransferase [Alteromonas sp. ASW11-130]